MRVCSDSALVPSDPLSSGEGRVEVEMDPPIFRARILDAARITVRVIEDLTVSLRVPKEYKQSFIEVSDLLSILISLLHHVANIEIGNPWFDQLQKLDGEDGPLDRYKKSFRSFRRPIPMVEDEVEGRKCAEEHFAGILATTQRLKSLIKIVLEMDHTKLPDTATTRDARPSLQETTTAVQEYTLLQYHREALDCIQRQLPGFRDLAKRALSCIIAAERRMTTEELRKILAGELGDGTLDIDNLEYLEDIIFACRGLVIVHQDSTIGLVHHTTQEYLEQVRFIQGSGTQNGGAHNISTMPATSVGSAGPTDEGYVSMTTRSHAKVNEYAEDSVTVYSGISSLIGSEMDDYVRGLADDLLGELSPDPTALAKVADILADKLGEFALRFGSQTSDQLHLNVMAFVYRYRHAVAEYFGRVSYAGEEEPENLPAKNNMSVTELVDRWYSHPEQESTPPTDCPDDLSEISETETSPTAEDPAYREVVKECPAYGWLISMLRREFYITSPRDTAMSAIRDRVMKVLPSTTTISRRKSPKLYTALFHMHWEVCLFFEEQQYGIPPDKAVLDALTLTASSESEVQCLPCLQYFRQTWPFTGPSFIRFISNVLRDPSSSTAGQLAESTALTAAPCHGSRFIITAHGTANAIAEVAEMLGWLGAAFASSYLDRGISYSTPIINEATQSEREQAVVDLHEIGAATFQFSIGHEIAPADFRDTQTEGQCWHDLFQNAVAVYGYPTLQRPQSQPGLEIPFHVMAALLYEERVHVFQQRPYIKAFNAMVFPARRCEGLIIWHLLMNSDNSHISYLDSRPFEIDEAVNIVDIETNRHILGWCASATYHAGCPEAEYNIGRSRLPSPHAGCILEKCSVSGGKFISAGVSFALGNRDKSVRITRRDYVRLLRWISKKYVVLWDEGEKRGWLVNGTSALLHLTRASLADDRGNKFQSACVFEPGSLKEAERNHAPDSALQVLLDKGNIQLKIYDNLDEDSEDEKIDGKIQKTEATKRSKKFYRFKDRVTDLLESLEKMIDHERSAQEESGVNIRMRTRKYLEGWDFRDVATDNDPFYPRIATLDAHGKGWVDFTQDIHAVTLFGKNFGDIIKPTASSNVCDHWAVMPHGKCYLAAVWQDLREIAELYGDPDERPMMLCRRLAWHNPGPDRCHCQAGERRNWHRWRRSTTHAEFAQVLLPNTFPRKSHGLPGPFAAFVFGHNRNFPWRWGDCGDPVATEPPDVAVEAGQGKLAVSEDPVDNSSSVGGSSAATSTFSPNVSETTERTEISAAQSIEEVPNTSVQRDLCTPTSQKRLGLGQGDNSTRSRLAVHLQGTKRLRLSDSSRP